MNVKVTIGAVVVLLAGMGVLIVVGDAPPSITGPEGLWPDFAAADVSELSWVAGTGPVHVRRMAELPAEWEVETGGVWVPAAAERVEEVLNEIGRTEVLQQVPGDSIDAALREEWGLVTPAQSMTFRLRGETVKLSFGAAALGRDATYAVRGDVSDVFVVSDDLQETLLDTPVNELRRRRVFSWRVAEVDRLEVRRGDELTFAAARQKDNRFFWWAEKPWTGFVSDRLERDLIPAVLRMEITEFVSDDADVVKLGDCGLVEPTWRVTLFRGRGAGDSRTVEIGAPVEGQANHVYFRVAGRSFIYSGDGRALLKSLSEDPDTLRDRNLTRLGWEPLGRVRGEIDGVAFVLQREGDVWVISEPEGMSADALSVEDWFTAIRKFEVLEFVDDPDLKALGLEEPSGRLTLWRPAPEGQALGDVAVSVHLGKRTADGIYARRTTGDEKVFLADLGLVDLLEPGAWQFRSKRVFTTRPRDPGALALRRAGILGDAETDLVDGAWSNGADTAHVTRLIDYLFAASVLRWVGPATDAAACGLAEPGAGTITLSLDSRTFGLILGSETEGGRFARAVRDGKPGEAIFVLDDAMVKLLSSPLK